MNAIMTRYVDAMRKEKHENEAEQMRCLRTGEKYIRKTEKYDEFQRHVNGEVATMIVGINMGII